MCCGRDLSLPREVQPLPLRLNGQEDSEKEHYSDYMTRATTWRGRVTYRQLPLIRRYDDQRELDGRVVLRGQADDQGK